MFSLYVMVFEPKALLATHTYSPASESETCPKSYEFVTLLKDELTPTMVGCGTPLAAQERLLEVPV